MRNKNRARSFMQVRRSRSKRGVSPVIGVILMVAATIVIAGVVMGMLGGFGPPKTGYVITVTAAENATGYIHVVFAGGPDANMVESFSCKVDDTDLTLDSTVGSTNSTQGTKGPNNNHVIVTATYKDGTSAVVLDTWV